MKAHAYLKADALVAEARAAHQVEVAAERRTPETRAFGFADDPDSFRAALDGASARIATPSQAASALARARRTGDAVAAHAVFVRAHELGCGDVVQQYTQDHPSTASALQALSNLLAPQRASLSRECHAQRIARRRLCTHHATADHSSSWTGGPPSVFSQQARRMVAHLIKQEAKWFRDAPVPGSPSTYPLAQ